MKTATPLFALLLPFLLAAPATAQTSPSEGAVTEAMTVTDDDVARAGISMGEEVGNPDDALGATYVKETFGDWQMTCERTDLGADPCQLYQLMQDEQGNSVAEINVFNLPGGSQAVAGATIITPLETLLTAQVTMRVDSAAAKRYPFTLCASIGCIARIGFTADELNAFRRGNKASIVIVPAMLPDEQVEITMSLNGFTKGYEAVVTANDAADAAAVAAAQAAEDAPADD